ncbi:MAG: pilus assembly protein TadG-related protein, partial [Alphaproteobacteria bacterium]
MAKRLNRLTSAFPPFRAFARDEGGAVAVIFAVMLTALVGMMALAMDLGRAWNLETQLQHAADACALAAATQLDGADGARARAIEACTNAASKLVDNEQRFASDGLGADVTFDTKKTVDADGKSENRDIKFYTELPVSAAVEATTDADARFVEANVFPRRVDFAFAAVVGAVSSASPRARAVAGFETFFCDSPPMMMCNPSEDPDGDAGATFDFYDDCPDYGDLNTSCQGRGITMKAQQGQLTNGNFGFLSISVLSEDGTSIEVDGSVPAIQDALASVDYDAICTDNDVPTKPGNMASIDRYINMRFDLYFRLADENDPNKQPARVTNRGLMPEASMDPTTGSCVFN